MTQGISLAPVWFGDVIGSALMILLALLCLVYASRLRRARPENVMWMYLFFLSLALTVFSVSRGVAHLAKHVLVMTGKGHVWATLSPFTGAFNSLTFMVVGSVTLFFQRVQRINRLVLNDKKALEVASEEVGRLNQDLQSLLTARTEQLRATQDRYRAIFERSKDMIFVLDDRGMFADINHAGLETLGYDSPDELAGRVSFEELFMHESDYRQLLHDLEREGFVRDRECRLRSDANPDTVILLSMTTCSGLSGGGLTYHGIAKDITARTRMDRQLQKADKLASLGQISAGIAHEINNPLGVILGYCQLIMRRQEKESQEYKDLAVIERQAKNCKCIVEDLLKFARATGTRKALIDINESLKEIVPLLAHQLELDNITVETSYGKDIPPIMADNEKIKQVLMNILINARQAIEDHGTITVKTEAVTGRDCIRISISDTGCGIPASIRDRIFDPFFTTKPVGEGTGLGLSLSYGIIQDHGGSIEVNSEEGSGSTFSILLPTGEMK